MNKNYNKCYKTLELYGEIQTTQLSKFIFWEVLFDWGTIMKE